MRRSLYFASAIAWRGFSILVDKIYWRISDLSDWTRNNADEAESRYRKGGQ
jgi:hypothetical protein